MAIKFTQIRDPKLQLTDKMLFGKFIGCRICDCIEDNYEYFNWLHKNTSVNFSQEVLDSIKEFQTQATQKRHYEEEEKPWASDTNYFLDIDDDIPF